MAKRRAFELALKTRAALRRSDLSRAGLAKQVSVTDKAVCRWEAQGSVPQSPQTCRAVAAVLG